MLVKFEKKDIFYIGLIISILGILCFFYKNINENNKKQIENRLIEVCFKYKKVNNKCKTNYKGYGCEWICEVKANNNDINFILNK